MKVELSILVCCLLGPQQVFAQTDEFDAEPSLSLAHLDRSLQLHFLCILALVLGNFRAAADLFSKQIKQPSAYQQPTRHTSSTVASSNGFAKSIGPGRHAPSDRSHAAKTSGRSIHSRSRSQAPRPRTAYGHREDDHFDSCPANNGTSQANGRVCDTPLPEPLHCPKVRSTQRSPRLPAIRDSSLTARFSSLSIDDDDGNRCAGSRVTSRSSSSLHAQSLNSGSLRVSKIKEPSSMRPPPRPSTAQGV